jgi:catalase
MAPLATRRVAILLAPGAEVGAMKVLQQALHDHGIVTRVVASHLGVVSTSSGQQVAVDHTLATMPSVMFDGVLVPAGASCAQLLSQHGDAQHFVLEAYRHGKALCLIGESAQLLERLHPSESPPPGVVLGSNDPATRLQMAQEFIQALGRHRHWLRPGADSVPA